MTKKMQFQAAARKESQKPSAKMLKSYVESS